MTTKVFESVACPSCGAHPPRLVLLTTMTRYYACPACEHRWDGLPERRELPMDQSCSTTLNNES
jgi:DNA-directed RNA polymerase subunit RPC12/RpoP